MGRYADPRSIPWEPSLTAAGTELAPAPGAAPGRVAYPADTLLRLTCYSTEPGDDPVAQVRAGAYEIEALAPGSAEAAAALVAPGNGVVLIACRNGALVGDERPASDLFCLAGYPEASHCPGALVVTVGHRLATTRILRDAGLAWRGDHLVLTGADGLAVFLATLHHLAGHNLAALTSGAALIGWRDVFPSVRVESPVRTSHPGM